MLLPQDISVRKTMELRAFLQKLHMEGFAMIAGDGTECIKVVTDGDIRHKAEGASMDDPIAN